MEKDEQVEETVYTAEGREELVADGEMSPEEEGFMEGAEGDGEDAKCAHCGAILMDAEHTFEREIDGKIHRFCSEHHAEEYEEKKKGTDQLE